MRPLRIGEGNVGWVFSSVKSYWEEDVRDFVLKNVRRKLEGLLKAEFRGVVGCGRYRRTKRRKGHRNGFYQRGLQTLYGWLEGIRVPRLRNGGWEPEVLEKYSRRTPLLDRLILEGFLLGHSTRKTVRLFKRQFGGSISPQVVSNVVRVLQGEVSAFHRRLLADGYRFIYLDGLWLKVTSPVKARRVLLVAYGVKDGGNRELIDFMLATSESEACWWGFLLDLKARGLEGRPLEVIIHDGSGGLAKALKGLYPRVRTQLCIFHKLSNISQNLIDRTHRSRILKDAAAIYQAETEKELREAIKEFRAKWEPKEPKAVRAFMRGFEETLTFREYDEPLRSALKTNNPLERFLEELQRRIKPFRKFANVGSVDRIVYGIVAHVLETREPNNLSILHN